MPVENKNCETYSMLVRCTAGFVYADFQNHLIGADPIVLKGAGAEGKDIQFAAPWEFVEENHLPGRFGLTKDDGTEVYGHVSTCGSVACEEAQGRLTRTSKLLSRDSQLEGLMIAAQFNPKNGSKPLVLDKEHGWGTTIDALSPVFNWYIEGRKDFAWPGEGRVRFEGYCGLHLDDEGVHFSQRTQEGSVLVPYQAVRKVRCADRDVWRNPAVYHVELSHPNEQNYRRTGYIALELMENGNGMETVIGKINSPELGLSRIK